MPNQLSSTKRRKSLAEHEAVLSALNILARHDGTSVMIQMRRAIRKWIKQHPDANLLTDELLKETQSFAPKLPDSFSSRRQVERFKKEQREFDQIMLDLGLASADAVDVSNSVVSPGANIQVAGFGERHGA
ncbi:MAG: hypothetical protein RRC34_02070 [Lentisphaeria bacterium]|nr:hypothetical protein [Lentisphaeria bacterium]